MTDNVTVSNSSSSSNADIPVRSIDKSGYQTQVVTLDLGGSGAEALTSGTVPVSGTVTVDTSLLATSANQPCIIGHVDGIESALATLNAKDFATQTTLSALNTKVTACDTTGLATAANQTTIIGHVDGIEGLLTTIDADTGGIATSAASIDGKITACNTGAVTIAALPNEGQQTMANSISVAVASNQSVIPAGGEIAHDGIDSGNPIKLGHRAIAHGTNPTAVAANDRTDWYANRHGVPWVIGGHPNVVTLRANYAAAQTNVAIITVSTGTKIVVTRCSALCSAANTVNVSVVIGFATATTPTTTQVVLAHPNIPAGSGVVEGNGGGILGIGADNEDLRITCSVPTSGSIDIVVSYYTIES